jgi:hypothetical protein
MIKHYAIIINSNDTDTEIINKLKTITDDDFNGNNGDKYLYPFFRNKYKSNLEGLYHTNKKNIQSKDDLINFILENCYSDSYYKEHSIEIIEQNESLFISVVAIY